MKYTIYQKRLLKLAWMLDQVPQKKFHMSDLVKVFKNGHQVGVSEAEAYAKAGECGTTACVAGWVCIMAYPKKQKRVKALKIFKRNIGFQHAMWGFAQKYLGLTDDQANWLFNGEWSHDKGTGEDHPSKAAAAVRHFVLDPTVTENNDWSI